MIVVALLALLAVMVCAAGIAGGNGLRRWCAGEPGIMGASHFTQRCGAFFCVILRFFAIIAIILLTFFIFVGIISLPWR